MARYIALFALVVGASALQNAQQQLETLQKTSQDMNNMLDDFAKKDDLKEDSVFEEYVALREGAKQAAAAAKEFRTRFPPAPNDWHNDDDELEVEAIEEDKIEAALKAKKQEEKEEDEVEDAKEETKKGAKKMKLKGLTRAEKLRKFQSPYRAASAKTEEKPLKVLNEGKGTYGKFSDIILGSSLLETEEEPKKKILSLEDTIAKREKELKLEALLNTKALDQVKIAKKLCDKDLKCIEKVDKKFKNGGYVHDLKQKLETKETKKKV